MDINFFISNLSIDAQILPVSGYSQTLKILKGVKEKKKFNCS